VDPTATGQAGRPSIASAPLPDTDLSTRADVEALLHRFYGRALVDDLLAGPFEEVRAKGLESHLPVMCDFWETVLFRAGLYQGSALQVHRPVHDSHPLTGEHFLRWLGVWTDTVDQMLRVTDLAHGGVVAVEAGLGMN